MDFRRTLIVRKVGIIMGSDSDLPVIKKATDQLRSLGIPFEVHVYSAHRTPEEARAFAVNARKNGFGAVIAAAGMAARSISSTSLLFMGTKIRFSSGTRCNPYVVSVQNKRFR